MKIQIYYTQKSKNSNYNVKYVDDNSVKFFSLKTKDKEEAKKIVDNLKDLVEMNSIYNFESFKNCLFSIISDDSPNQNKANSSNSNYTKIVENGLSSTITVKNDSTKEVISILDDFSKEMESHGLSLNNISYKQQRNQDDMEYFSEVTANYKLARYKYVEKKNEKINLIKSKDKLDKYLLINDLHIPFHNEKLFYTLIQMAIDLKFYGIIVNGDLLDLDFLSGYEKSSKILSESYIRKSFQKAGELMEYISNSPFQFKAFIEGNHDERLSRDILGNGISGKGILQYDSEYEFYSIPCALNFPKGWITKRYGERLEIGNFYIEHGVEYGKTTNPDMIRENTIMGHVHRPDITVGYKVTDNGKREPLFSYRVGCLIDKYSNIPAKSRKTVDAWNNGFAVLNVINGKTYVDNVVVYDDHYFYNNTIYFITKNK